MMRLKTKNAIKDSVVSVIAIMIGLVIIFPIIYCVCGAFKTESEFLTPNLLPGSFSYTKNFSDALRKGDLIRYI